MCIRDRGAIEIKPEELRILSESETPPFPIEENSKTKEEVRLKYRFLDLRRPDIQRNLMMRSRVATLARQFMAKEGFLEIETPFLIKSTPEGARDYLVPSRIHPGSFYALPQMCIRDRYKDGCHVFWRCEYLCGICA